MSVWDGVSPPPHIPLMLFDTAPVPFLGVVKSPKSIELPVDAIVTNSIVFTLPGDTYPKLNTPRVGDEQPDPVK